MHGDENKQCTNGKSIAASSPLNLGHDALTHSEMHALNLGRGTGRRQATGYHQWRGYPAVPLSRFTITTYPAVVFLFFFALTRMCLYPASRLPLTLLWPFYFSSQLPGCAPIPLHDYHLPCSLLWPYYFSSGFSPSRSSLHGPQGTVRIRS